MPVITQGTDDCLRHLTGKAQSQSSFSGARAVHAAATDQLHTQHPTEMLPSLMTGAMLAVLQAGRRVKARDLQGVKAAHDVVQNRLGFIRAASGSAAASWPAAPGLPLLKAAAWASSRKEQLQQESRDRPLIRGERANIRGSLSTPRFAAVLPARSISGTSNFSIPVVGSPRQDPNTGLFGVRPGVHLSSERKIHVFHDLDNLRRHVELTRHLVAALKFVLQPIGMVVSIIAYGNPSTLTYRNGYRAELGRASVQVREVSARKEAADQAIISDVKGLLRTRTCDAVCIISNDKGFFKIMQTSSERGLCSIAVCDFGQGQWLPKAGFRYPGSDVTVDFRTIERLAIEAEQKERDE